MPRDKVNPKLARIMGDLFHFNPRELSLDDSTDNIEEWDSLGHIELILSIEETFKVKFSTEMMRKLTSVRLLQDTLKRRKAI